MELDATQVEALLARLKGLLDAGDFSATNVVRESETILRAVLGPSSAAFFAGVDGFRFDDANRVLRAAHASWTAAHAETA